MADNKDLDKNINGEQPIETNFGKQSKNCLRECVENTLQRYFENLNGVMVTGLYAMVLAEIEEPMLKILMNYVRGNQSKAAMLSGLSRGTLRTKLKAYAMLLNLKTDQKSRVGQ